jgi:NAD(P)-dependent dehydrogenase (short-subunit alcohol dehydrogenase family)
VLDTNLTSAMLLTRAAFRVLRRQGLGGSIVYVASKNAFGPGAGFGAYSVSKAGMVQLMRVAAIEGGPEGIRANAVNPDAVFDGSKLWTQEVRRDRAAVHGIAAEDLEAFYAQRNLLRAQVSAEDVAQAVAFLLSEQSCRTTGAVLPVDGGVPAAFPR